MALVDSHGRKINYLRLSVTDRCNLRCTYCMPAQGVEKLACDDVLRYEELLEWRRRPCRSASRRSG
jgi:GTP 3',8-cyclase